jgi:hypothetical protein
LVQNTSQFKQFDVIKHQFRIRSGKVHIFFTKKNTSQTTTRQFIHSKSDIGLTKGGLRADVHLMVHTGIFNLDPNCWYRRSGWCVRIWCPLLYQHASRPHLPYLLLCGAATWRRFIHWRELLTINRRGRVLHLCWHHLSYIITLLQSSVCAPTKSRLK